MADAHREWTVPATLAAMAAGSLVLVTVVGIPALQPHPARPISVVARSPRSADGDPTRANAPSVARETSAPPPAAIGGGPPPSETEGAGDEAAGAGSPEWNRYGAPPAVKSDEASAVKPAGSAEARGGGDPTFASSPGGGVATSWAPAASSAPSSYGDAGAAVATTDPSTGADGGPGSYPILAPLLTVRGAPTDAGPSAAGSPGGVNIWPGGGSSTGGGIGGGAGGSAATTFTAALMLPMSESEPPESAWGALSAYVRPGDVVIARAGSVATGRRFADLGDRILGDRPQIGYYVTFSDASALRAASRQPFPATVAGAGLSSVDALDLATLTTLSAATRGAGKRFVATVSTTPRTLNLVDVGARVDLVELTPAAADVNAFAKDAAAAIAALQAGGATAVYVRLPATALASAQDAATFANAVTSRVGGVGGVGVSLPAEAAVPSFLASLR